MTDRTDADEIRHDEARRRFELVLDGHTAEITYHRVGDRLVIDHTGVPDELGGRGLGGRLVRAVVDHAVAEGLTIDPQCPFARRWLQGHAEVAATATIDWGD